MNNTGAHNGYLDVGEYLAENANDRQPYDSYWSLAPLLEYSNQLTPEDRQWLQSLEDKMSTYRSDAADAESPLDERDVHALVRFFFPPFKHSMRLGALLQPLSPRQALATSAWLELLQSGNLSLGREIRSQSAAVRAGMIILNQHYGQALEEAHETILDYYDEHSGLTSHLRVMSGYDYVEVMLNGEKPNLEQRDIRNLLGNPNDTDLWEQLLPPSVFSFRGLEINHILDATQEVSHARLQRLLLKREAVLSESRIAQLEEVLKGYLRVSDLRMGIMALDYPLSQAVAHRYLIRQDLLGAKIERVLDPSYGDSIYRETCAHGNVRIYDDLHDCLAETGELEERLMEKGIRSLVLVPLFGKGDHIIGMLELASKRPFAFSNLVLYQLDAIAPLFRQAIRRSRDDMEARIQSVMRKNFTALDPSIEWRFVQAAAELIEHEQNADEEEEQEQSTIEEIRFEKVWALYAQADIVSSSYMRNEAIRKDLLLELRAARKLLKDPAIALRFPLAGKLVFDVDELIAALEEEMSPNEEQRVIDFLRHSFKPTVKQLSHMSELKERVKSYSNNLEASRKNGLTHREAYEQSVRKVTNVVNNVISKQQAEAQRIVPHYFNKYRTDGIEFNMYAGQSLLRDGTFSKVHLQNLRLWQLQTMVYVTKAIAGLQDSLAMPMSTAQLIFVFGTTITIQFRMDEKRFDVEGAYNVRYEVIKKRIDKALIRGSEERLTLADHVAIVYTHHSDRRMYHEFIEYLHGIGEVKHEAEDLELEPMQGVDGLYAIRVKVV